jgi:membrane protease YdiL (CAAX protease family)
VLSALSLFIAFQIIEPLARWLDPQFTLLTNRGIGKIALTVLVLYQLLLLVVILPKQFLSLFWKTNVAFFAQRTWVTSFFTYFGIFFALHGIIIYICYLMGVVAFNPDWGQISSSFFLKMTIGFIATFFLAWTEELIFRGTLYLYFANYLLPLTAALIASLIFSLSHNLTAPWKLVTTNWQLGLGLFLLGLFLNLVFIITGKLYTGMGAHAGLKFVKVFLKRMPFVVYLPVADHSLLVHSDLRQSFLVLALFIIINGCLILKFRKRLMLRT